MLSTLSRFMALRTATATIFTVLVYGAILITTAWQDEPRPAPKHTESVDLSQALNDLKLITSRPHPYNSHQNDLVRGYILDRIQGIAQGNNNVFIVDDLVSNATYANSKDVVYHESLNLLVAINGTSNHLDGVLFSAHFDSVSTAPGATDDGMGVATLLQLIQHFATHPPHRNVVFNINNGEEDWLNGAHVFLEHPLSHGLRTFLNLEGAGSGGRPLLFRTSSARVTRFFRAVPHPHGTTIAADAFKAGFIRSGTDFSVYEQAGLEGLDFAFYRHRNQYHTKYDSVANLNGRASLWNMLESSLAAANAMTDDDEVSERPSDALYFDVLGEGLVVLSRRTALILNIIVLIIGPIAALILGYFAIRANKLYWPWHGWIRFPIAVILSAGLAAALVFSYGEINPYIPNRSPLLVLLSFACLVALSIYGILKAFATLLPIPSQRQIVLIEYFVLCWALLVCNTIALDKFKLGSLYPTSFFYGGALLALLIGLLEVVLFKPLTPSADLQNDPDDPNVETALVVERAQPPSADESDERTPLLVTRHKVVGLKTDIYDEKQAGGMWAWQYLVAVPFPVLLIAQLTWSFLLGFNGAMADGGSPSPLFVLAALTAFLMIVPLAPFIHKLHWVFMAIVAVIFVISTLYNLLSFPFTSSDPLKVFFKQTVDLDTGTNNVYLEGVPMYLRHFIIDEIPSSHGSGGVWCSDQGIRPLLQSCRWSGIMPNVADTTFFKLINHSAKRIGGKNSTQAQFTVRGRNTRACRIYFDSVRVHDVRVHGASRNGDMQPGYGIEEDGISVIKLWSRTWDREWTVDVEMGPNATTGEVNGRVACEWSENIDSRIPALEEIMTFMPKWAAVTKSDDGLVEAWYKFSI